VTPAASKMVLCSVTPAELSAYASK
jgi:hypothetical protein